MLRNIILTLLVVAQAHINSQAQDLSHKYLFNQFEIEDGKKFLYVVNGVSYDTLSVDSVLSTFSSNLLVSITKINQLSNPIFCNRNSEVVLIVFAVQQPSRVINNKVKKAKKTFKDNYYGFSNHILNNSKDPVLIIDNKQIHHTEVKSKLKNLRVYDIFYIDHLTEPQAAENYGQNADNGVIRIWTKSYAQQL